MRARRRRCRRSRRAGADGARSSARRRRRRSAAPSSRRGPTRSSGRGRSRPDRCRARRRSPPASGRRRPRSAAAAFAISICSGPRVPRMFSQPGSPLAISSAMRRRSSRLPIVRSVPAAPPSCAQPGRMLASKVLPAPYGYWSNVTSSSVAALSSSSSSGSIRLSSASDLRCETWSGAPERRATSIISATASSSPLPLVPDMGHERHAEGGGLLGDRDELVGGGVGARQVDEPEREHAGAGLEAEANLASHVAQALGVRLDPPASEHELAHGAVADRGHERERGPGGVERVEVLLDRRPRPCLRDRRLRAAAGTPGAPPAARARRGRARGRRG